MGPAIPRPVSYTHLMFIAFLGLFHKVYACGTLAGIVLTTTKVNEFLSAMNRVHAVSYTHLFGGTLMIKTARQLKDLIRNLSKDKSADAQILMRNYMMERFLAVSYTHLRQSHTNSFRLLPDI